MNGLFFAGKYPAGVVQAKLALNRPNDPFEQEADAVANRVMDMPDRKAGSEAFFKPGLSALQRKCARCGKEEKPLQRKPGEAHRTAAQDDLEAFVPQLAGKGMPLPQNVREFFEPRVGYDFSQVRVHTDHAAAESAQSINALAYTTGNNIVFNAGQFAPDTAAGKRLLGHELTHVVQQNAGMRTHTVQRKLVATGSSGDFVDMVNEILGVQFEIKISKTGEISIHRTDVQGPPTRDATELLTTLRTVVNDTNTTSIEFIHGNTSARASDRNVIVGNYALNRVDLDDVAAFGAASSHSRMGDNRAVQLIHEITEQYRKQVHGENFATAHAAGYAAQERLLGATLVNETPMTPIAGTTEGQVTTTYRYPDGREVDVIVRMDFATGRIVNVRRVVR